MEALVVVVTIGTAAHISRQNKHPGIDGVESRDTVAGVDTSPWVSATDTDVALDFVIALSSVRGHGHYRAWFC